MSTLQSVLFSVVVTKYLRPSTFERKTSVHDQCPYTTEAVRHMRPSIKAELHHGGGCSPDTDEKLSKDEGEEEDRVKEDPRENKNLHFAYEIIENSLRPGPWLLAQLSSQAGFLRQKRKPGEGPMLTDLSP
ncbi:hypothetical protein STEG23_018719 [Scotinomys teguina]